MTKNTVSHCQNIPFRVLKRKGGETCSLSRHKSRLAPVSSSPCPLRKIAPPKTKDPESFRLLFPSVGVSHWARLGAGVCLLARAARVLFGAGLFALVCAAPFLEICVSRSAVA